jgi:hypothetical protein
MRPHRAPPIPNCGYGAPLRSAADSHVTTRMNSLRPAGLVAQSSQTSSCIGALLLVDPLEQRGIALGDALLLLSCQSHPSALAKDLVNLHFVVLSRPLASAWLAV